jgi:hypothetical protein
MASECPPLTTHPRASDTDHMCELVQLEFHRLANEWFVLSETVR